MVNSNPNNVILYTGAESLPSILKEVYLWMFGALLITGCFAMVAERYMLGFMMEHPSVPFLLIVAELALVIGLSMRLSKMSYMSTALALVIYSALNGLTLSFILIAYTTESIYQAFFLSSLTFLAMSLVGMKTKKDLTFIGRTLYSLLLGLIIVTVFNIFFRNSFTEWIINYVGVFLFLGLTAYDTWKIKVSLEAMKEKADDDFIRKMTVYYALDLYLDFINLFIYLLRIFGKRK